VHTEESLCLCYKHIHFDLDFYCIYFSGSLHKLQLVTCAMFVFDFPCNPWTCKIGLFPE
jgi:hypothetical protein